MGEEYEDIEYGLTVLFNDSGAIRVLSKLYSFSGFDASFYFI